MSNYCGTRLKSGQKINGRAKSLKAAIVAYAKEYITSAPVLVFRQMWKPCTPPLAVSKLLKKGPKFIFSVKFSQSFGLSISPSDLMNSRHQDTLHLAKVMHTFRFWICSTYSHGRSDKIIWLLDKF